MPIAETGDISDIPVTTPTGTGQLSFQSGFPFVTQVPLLAGGIAPSRMDFNAVMNLLSQHAFFAQSGGVYPWMGADGDFPGLNYLTGWHAMGSDGQEYVALLPSGPDVPASGGGLVGPKDPTTEATYWRNAGAMPIDNLTLKKTEDGTVYAVDGTTSQKGVVQLTSTISPTDETKALTPKGAWNAKQLITLGSRSTTGSWSITGVTVGFPLWIVMDGTNESNDSECRVKAISGTSTGRAPYGGTGGAAYNLWADTAYTAGSSSNVLLCVPTASTVVMQVLLANGIALYAMQ